MIPKEFAYAAPATLDEALDLLAGGGDDAKVLAGGHSLIPLMKLRLAEAGTLVDIGRIGALRGIMGGDTESSLGAMTTHREVMGATGGALGLLSECAASIGDTQVRNRGTLGGSLAHADPAADYPAAILALDAEIEAAHKNGTITTRRIKAANFFTGLLTTALEPGEILTQVWVPTLHGRTGTAYVKLRNKASHYALVGVAAVVTLGADGKIARATIGVTGGAATPFRATAAESALQGVAPSKETADSAAAQVAASDIEWMSDLHGSSDYLRHMAEMLTRRAVRLAVQRAG